MASIKVVSVRVCDIRPLGYNDLKEWCDDKNNLYIGRKGIVFINGFRYPPKDSKWANPFKVGKDGDLEEVLKKYEDYIIEKVSIKDYDELKGKNLGCWCRTGKNKDSEGIICHGDILKRIVSCLDSIRK